MSRHIPTVIAGLDRRAAPTVVSGTTPLGVVENTLRSLSTGPARLCVDGRRLGHGLPRRLIPLTELASILMHPSTTFVARDEVWRLLVDRSRTGGPRWVLGAVGVALPALWAAAHRLGTSKRVDVQAELLLGFVTALATVDVSGGRVCSRLCNTAFVAARAALRVQEPATSGEANLPPGSTVTPSPFGHPDFVLAHAVVGAVISAEEAELIGATRLEAVPIADYAGRTGQPLWAVYKMRTRAEARLVTAIRAGWVADPDAEVIAEATMTVVADRPRR